MALSRVYTYCLSAILISFIYNVFQSSKYVGEAGDFRRTMTDPLAEQLALSFMSHPSGYRGTRQPKRLDIRHCSIESLYPKRWIKRYKKGKLDEKKKHKMKSSLKECRQERQDEFLARGIAEYRAMSQNERDQLVVFPDDEFYKSRYLAPVVVEEFKLVFFPIPKVACTQWLQLFRRIAGQRDWKMRGQGLPYTPDQNGLTYLTHYDLTDANRIMTSSEWTRAVFVRDSKERFLSAYLDKVVNTKNIAYGSCCPETKDCVSSETTLQDFFDLTETCDNEHWAAQSERFPDRIWQTINFVGHMETLQEDARRLLQQVGAWDGYASSGWGLNGNQAVFAGQSSANNHATGSQDRLRHFYTPSLERAVEERFHRDYENNVFRLPERKIFNT